MEIGLGMILIDVGVCLNMRLDLSLRFIEEVLGRRSEGVL